MSQPRKVFLSAIVGNILEYYDFTVYSIFAVEIGRAFFSGQPEFIQILSSLAVFAVGFLTRPIGGIIFGSIGDTHGRRIALICSVLGMTLSTFIIGIIPTNNQIGILAPLLLITMRLIQGLCISGEGTGAAIFVLEHYGNLRSGFITGLVQGSNITGTLLASFVGILLSNYFEHLEDAWRFAFILGGIMGLIGFYLRLQVAETPIFKELQKTKSIIKTPLIYVIKNEWRPMLMTFVTAAMASSIVYMIKTYINIFYRVTMAVDTTTALSYLSYSSFILMITMPISGALADYFGKIKTITFAAILVIIFAFPVLYLMSSEHVSQQIIGMTMLSILAGLVSGVAYIFVISLFQPKDRFTGVAFSYNLGIALFGGTSAMVSGFLVKITGVNYSPALYVVLTSMLFLLTLNFLKEEVVSRNKI